MDSNTFKTALNWNKQTQIFLGSCKASFAACERRINLDDMATDEATYLSGSILRIFFPSNVWVAQLWSKRTPNLGQTQTPKNNWENEDPGNHIFRSIDQTIFEKGRSPALSWARPMHFQLARGRKRRRSLVCSTIVEIYIYTSNLYSIVVYCSSLLFAVVVYINMSNIFYSSSLYSSTLSKEI